MLAKESVDRDGDQLRNQQLAGMLTTSSPELIKPRMASGTFSLGQFSGKSVKVKNGVDVEAIKSRVDKGTAVVSGILSTFAGSGDSSTLEDAFSKYDELMEDIEADLTKAKIGLGLKLEESLKDYKKSSDRFFRSLRSFSGTSWGYFPNQGGNYFPQLDEKDLKKRVMKLNEMLNKGFEGFLEMSEKSKDVLRRMYKRRYEMRNGFNYRQNKIK